MRQAPVARDDSTLEGKAALIASVGGSAATPTGPIQTTDSGGC